MFSQTKTVSKQFDHCHNKQGKVRGKKQDVEDKGNGQ